MLGLVSLKEEISQLLGMWPDGARGSPLQARNRPSAEATMLTTVLRLPASGTARINVCWLRHPAFYYYSCPRWLIHSPCFVCFFFSFVFDSFLAFSLVSWCFVDNDMYLGIIFFLILLITRCVLGKLTSFFFILEISNFEFCFSVLGTMLRLLLELLSSM